MEWAQYGIAGGAILLLLTVAASVYRFMQMCPKPGDSQADKGFMIIIENNTQAIRDVGKLVQLTQASLQASITGQATMMEILRSIKSHCDQENGWWMDQREKKGC